MAVIVERSGPVTTIVLSRPDVRNAVDRATAKALAEAFLAFDADREARIAVFHGANGVFSSGADLKALAAARGNLVSPPAGGADTDAPMGPTRLMLRKPVLAAISGYAVAGGLELALWCDLRIAEEDAILGVFSRRFGVPLIDGGTVRLPRIVGLGRALDLILTGRPIDANEALAMGLVNRVVAKGEGRAAAEAMAAALARFPEAALRNDRRSVYEQCGMAIDAALANEFRLGLETLASGETASGASAFVKGEGRGGRPRPPNRNAQSKRKPANKSGKT